MSNALLIIDSTQRSLLFKGSANRISIGRVSSNDFVIRHDTISRSHAEFYQVGQDWVIMDLGSTNGTFLNNSKLMPQNPVLLRAGDSLRLGDIQTTVSEEGNVRSVPSLYVFKQSTYEGEFPISATTDFSFGGLNATIPADELSTNDLIFIIRQDQNGLLMSCKSDQITPLLNGQEVSGRVTLSDRDIIKIASLQVLVSYRDPSQVHQIVDSLNSGLEGADLGQPADADLEIPDYLKSRMGDEGWEDPLQKKRKRTATVFSLDEIADDDPEHKSGSTLRSQAELVGVQRFSMPNPETVRVNEERQIKRQALIGIASLFILMIMILVLVDLYKDVFFGQS
jgi:pSer/pThr/pTyr-binding forkhead associated (FHA) protein